MVPYAPIKEQNSDDLVNRLLGLPTLHQQKQLLAEHRDLLDDRLVDLLRDHAAQFLRANVQRSLTLADLMFDVAQLTGNVLHQAQGALVKANALSLGGLGEYERAVVYYNQAAQLYQERGFPVDQARAQIGKVLALAHLGSYPEAIATGEWASLVLEQHQQWLLLAKLIVNLGLIQLRLGEDEKALTLFERARQLYDRVGDEGELRSAVGRVEHNRAIALRNLGRFAESMTVGQESLAILLETGQLVEAARNKQTLAVTYFVLGRYNEALQRLSRAQEIFANDGRWRDAIRAELYMSDCLLQLRRFSDVLSKCRLARARLSESGIRLEVAQSLLNEASAHAGLHQYVEAEAALAQARGLFVAEGNQLWVAQADLALAVILQRHGQSRESLALAQACLQVFRQHHVAVEEAKAALVAAQANLGLARYAEAIALTQAATAIGQAHQLYAITYQCHHLAGLVAVARGQPTAALAAYSQAINELEQLRGRLMVEFRTDFLEDKEIVYEEMVGLCLEQGQTERGLVYAERAKSRALLDLLAFRLDIGIQARQPEDQGLVDQLLALRSERNRLVRRWESRKEFALLQNAHLDLDAEALQRLLQANEQQITELWHKLLIRNADYASDAALWQMPEDMDRPTLPADTMLLEYFVVGERFVVFLVSQAGVEARYLPAGPSAIQPLLQKLKLNWQAVLRQPGQRLAALKANADGLLQQLYHLLIEPLANRLTSYSQLIIVPHGVLHYLPFHAFYDGHRYLLERYEISYLPGMSMLKFCQRPHPTARGCLALGYSCGGKLPHAAAEAHAVARILGGEAVVEEEAMIARLRSTGADHVVIHLATHGDFRPDNPLFSGLALADGWLTTLDIFNLQLQAELVTLSACQTGINVIGAGDELLGLMRAFLYAGSQSILLSLWPVEDGSTACLMEHFYQQIAQGQRKGAALRLAQQHFIRPHAEPDQQTARYSHPYFWAPFFLIGHNDSASYMTPAEKR
jgi:CHAT domain-containing protein